MPIVAIHFHASSRQTAAGPVVMSRVQYQVEDAWYEMRGNALRTFRQLAHGRVVEVLCG